MWCYAGSAKGAEVVGVDVGFGAGLGVGVAEPGDHFGWVWVGLCGWVLNAVLGLLLLRIFDVWNLRSGEVLGLGERRRFKDSYTWPEVEEDASESYRVKDWF